ncbi:hypothetical protein ACH5RR_019989 [Cinchona calisaya]|uniref:Uncharacterized protein n=1 Tax=Cinchona calisaya TaxID=153742 RepID=A0ABD2ZD52_9GENT
MSCNCLMWIGDESCQKLQAVGVGGWKNLRRRVASEEAYKSRLCVCDSTPLHGVFCLDSGYVFVDAVEEWESVRWAISSS